MDEERKAEAIHLTKRMKNPPEMKEDWPRVNAYVCSKCGRIIWTVDCVEGTTPAFIGCEEEGCGGNMASSWYTVKPIDWEGEEITHEWVMPSLPIFRKMLRRNDDMADHVSRGGLVLHRGRSKRPVLTHGGFYLRDLKGERVPDEEAEKGLREYHIIRAEGVLWQATREKKMRIRNAAQDRKKAKARAKRKRAKKSRKR